MPTQCSGQKRTTKLSERMMTTVFEYDPEKVFGPPSTYISRQALLAHGMKPSQVASLLPRPDRVDEFRIYGRGRATRYWFEISRAQEAVAKAGLASLQVPEQTPPRVVKDDLVHRGWNTSTIRKYLGNVGAEYSVEQVLAAEARLEVADCISQELAAREAKCRGANFGVDRAIEHISRQELLKAGMTPSQIRKLGQPDHKDGSANHYDVSRVPAIAPRGLSIEDLFVRGWSSAIVHRLLGDGRHQPSKVLEAEKSPLFVAWAAREKGSHLAEHQLVMEAERRVANEELKKTLPGFVLKVSTRNTLCVATESVVFKSDGIAEWRMTEAISEGVDTGDWTGFVKKVLEWSENESRVRQNPGFYKAMTYVVARDSAGLEEWAGLERAFRMLMPYSERPRGMIEPTMGGYEWVLGSN